MNKCECGFILTGTEKDHEAHRSRCVYAENARLRKKLDDLRISFECCEQREINLIRRRETELKALELQVDEWKRKYTEKDLQAAGFVIELDKTNRLIREVMEKTKCNCAEIPEEATIHNAFCPWQMECIRDLHKSQKR